MNQKCKRVSCGANRNGARQCHHKTMSTNENCLMYCRKSAKRITHRKTHSHISQIWINIARCWRSESRAHFVTQWRKGSRRTSSVRSRSCKTKTASDLVNKAINISAAVLSSFTRAQCFICSGIHMKCKQPIRVEWVVTKSEQCSYKISRLAYSKHKREKSNCIAPRVEGVWEWSTFNRHKYFELFSSPLSLFPKNTQTIAYENFIVQNWNFLRVCEFVCESPNIHWTMGIQAWKRNSLTHSILRSIASRFFSHWDSNFRFNE